MNICISKLAEVIGADCSGPADIEISGVSTDSRTLRKGDCFFAIRGPNFDGHDYIQSAFKAGAVCAVSWKQSGLPNVLTVHNTVEAMGKTARYYRREAGFKVIAVTGSVGKTSTREMIYHCLAGKYKVHRSPGSFNNFIGVPLTLLSAERDCQFVVAEIGTNRPGEIAYLSGIAEPDIACVLNVGPAHLEGFGSIENVIKEKASIDAGLRPGGCYIVNGNFRDLIEYCRGKGRDFITFGQGPYCDIQGQHLRSSAAGGSMVIDGVKIEVNLPGRGNLENALAAWAVCGQAGLELEEFAKRISTAQNIDKRMDVVRIDRLTILDDCYNANLVSTANALETLAQISQGQSGRKVMIFSEMRELGQSSAELHRQLGEIVAGNGVELFIGLGDDAYHTAETAKMNSGRNFQYHIFNSTAELCDKLAEFVKPDDIILVKGSRAGRLELAVEALKSIKLQ